MSNGTTQHTPADVRERVARECVEEAERLRYWYGEWYARAQRLLREAAALLRTPRGEGEAWRAFIDALDEYEAAANLWADPEGPTVVDMERLRQSRRRVIECALALAALRSEAQGEDRWEDLVFRPIVEAYNEAHAAHPTDRSDDNASM